jgi:uncharacterized membrane protein
MVMTVVILKVATILMKLIKTLPAFMTYPGTMYPQVTETLYGWFTMHGIMVCLTYSSHLFWGHLFIFRCV